MELDFKKIFTKSKNKVKFEEKTFKDIYHKADVGSTGLVKSHELAVALADANMRDLAEGLNKLARKKNHLELTEEQFLAFCMWQKLSLDMIYILINTTSGDVSPEKLKRAFDEAGFKTTIEEAQQYIERIMLEGRPCTTIDECRNCYLTAEPVHSLHNIVNYWRMNWLIDIGENLIVPVKKNDKPNQNDNYILGKQLAAGGIAGISSRTFTAPIDRIKVLLQVNAGTKNREGIFLTLKNIYKEGGLTSFWRGNGVNCLKVAPESALRFTIYDNLKPYFNKDHTQNTFFTRLVSGSLAGFGSQLVVYPLEVLKTRMAVSVTGQYSGLWHAVQSILQKEGVSAFYKGLFPSLLGIIPYSGINLSVYETMKHFYMSFDEKQTNPPPTPVLVGCGAFSSTCGQLSSYPFVLLRTKLQVDHLSQINNSNPSIKVNSISKMLHVTKEIYKYDGLKGFYRGMGANFMKMLPSVSIGYTAYEKSKSAFGL